MLDEAEAQMDWTTWMAVLVDNNLISQKAADRYKLSQNLESNIKLEEIFYAVDEAGQSGDELGLLGQAASLIRVTNMRHGSAVNALYRKTEGH